MPINNFKIRPYRSTDSKQVAALMHSAFQGDGFQFLKNAKLIEWRFAQRGIHDYETHLFVCENTANSAIIGVVGCDFYEMWLQKRKIKIAELFGLSVHHVYQGQGWGRRLSQWLYQFVHDNKRDAMISSTDPSGKVFRSIEKPNGFQYLTTSRIYLGYGSAVSLLKQITPLAVILAPFFTLMKHFRLLPLSFSKFFWSRDYQVVKVTASQLNEFAAISQRINSRFFNFFPHIPQRAWMWARSPPGKSKLVEKPHFFQLSCRERPLAGISVSFQKVYIKFFRKVVRCAILNDVWVDYSCGVTVDHLSGYLGLFLSEIQKFITQHGGLLTIFMASASNSFFARTFSQLGFFGFDWSQISVNPISLVVPHDVRQVFVGNSVALNTLP